MSSTEITYTVTAYPGETEQMHCWTRTVDNVTVSQLWADLATGEIMQAETPAEHQGEGHASSLYRHATQTVDLLHAPESHRTPEGHRFALSVGGDSLPCTHGCCDTDED